MKTFKSFAEELETLPDGHANVARDLMPQIDDVKAFTNFLDSRHIEYNFATVPSYEIRPFQGEFDKEKVESMKDSITAKDSEAKPIIVSADSTIIDGHHRFLAARFTIESIPCLIIHKSTLDAFNLAKRFNSTKE